VSSLAALGDPTRQATAAHRIRIERAARIEAFPGRPDEE
jgi:hypothetical protein